MMIRVMPRKPHWVYTEVFQSSGAESFRTMRTTDASKLPILNHLRVSFRPP
jgi:hypothetical protein